jgi:hypothetical protein
LYDSPFKSYKAPGLILALLPGFSAATAALLLLFRTKFSKLMGIISGFLMAGYISVEVTVLNDNIAAPTGIESFYFALGVALSLLSLSLYWVGRKN